MKIKCRICKIQQGEFFPLGSTINSNGGEQKLLDLFNKCLQLQASLNDVICGECFNTLLLFHEMLLKALKTDEELKNALKEQSTKVHLCPTKAENEELSQNDCYESDIHFELEIDCCDTSSEDVLYDSADSPAIDEHISSGDPSTVTSLTIAPISEQDDCSKAKLFECEYCNKLFRQKSILKTHLTLHTGKIIECHICQKRFSRIAHLNVHLRTHNNLRPYNCNHCSKTYMQKSHLDRHVASLHLGIRFQCSICENKYTKKSSLNVHMREQHPEDTTLYTCNVCEKSFTKQTSFFYHRRSKHQGLNRNNNSTT